MSRENMELARQAFEAINAGDQDRFVASWTRTCGPTPGSWSSRAATAGHEGVRRWWDDITAVIPDLSYEIGEQEDLGDIVLTRFRDRGHGATSGAPIDSGLRWHASQWRAGLCVWWCIYSTEAEARAAAGLRE